MDWLLDDTPHSQIEEAMAYYRVAPFGDDWEQAAMIGSICSTAATNSKYKATIPASDLIPQFASQDDENKPKATEEAFNAQLAAMQQQLAMMGIR